MASRYRSRTICSVQRVARRADHPSPSHRDLRSESSHCQFLYRCKVGQRVRVWAAALRLQSPWPRQCRGPGQPQCRRRRSMVTVTVTGSARARPTASPQQMLMKGRLLLVLLGATAKPTICNLYFDEILSNHAVLQASPLPFSLSGYSDRFPGRIGVTLSGSKQVIPIIAAEVAPSPHNLLFSWRLVRFIAV